MEPSTIENNNESEQTKSLVTEDLLGLEEAHTNSLPSSGLPILTIDVPEDDDVELPHHNYDRLSEVINEFEKLYQQKSTEDDGQINTSDTLANENERLVSESPDQVQDQPYDASKESELVKVFEPLPEIHKLSEEKHEEKQENHIPDLFDILDQSIPKPRPTLMNRVQQWWNKYFC